MIFCKHLFLYCNNVFKELNCFLHLSVCSICDCEWLSGYITLWSLESRQRKSLSPSTSSWIYLIWLIYLCRRCIRVWVINLGRSPIKSWRSDKSIWRRLNKLFLRQKEREKNLPACHRSPVPDRTSREPLEFLISQIEQNNMKATISQEARDEVI